LLAGDVAATKLVIHEQDGPVILVGHSYGGAVITEAGTDPQVVGLVLHHCLCSRQGRVGELTHQRSAARCTRASNPATEGRLSFLDKSKFRASFAGDVEPEKAAFMADSQVPWGVEALVVRSASRPGKSKPSWYLLATEDRMIPPPAQRSMSERAGSTVVELAGSHAIYVSQPNAVVALIKQAAQGAAAATASS